MSKLLVLQGCPGSGKSTLAKKLANEDTSFVIVNRDSLRNMRGKYWLPEQEELITEWEISCSVSALKKGYNVIIDATNFNNRTIERWKEIAKKYSADIEFKLIDTPLDECIRRDNLRTEGKVGEEVIRQMHSKYIAQKSQGVFAPIVQNKDLPCAWIIDLDGSLALHNGRNPYDLDKVGTDILNEPIARIINNLHQNGDTIIFMSGREDKCKALTLSWLQMNNVNIGSLYMRVTGDTRGDDIVKHELFNLHVKDKFYVAGVIDDRPKVIRMWRNIGLFVFNVGDGHEF